MQIFLKGEKYNYYGYLIYGYLTTFVVVHVEWSDD
jgi:hypothetical protein